MSRRTAIRNLTGTKVIVAMSAMTILSGGTLMIFGRPYSTQAAENAAWKQPFMIREAGLPKGYPPPGPVGQVIVKEYPAHRLARIRSGISTDSMFMPLFNHIKRNSVPMTAPVEIGYKTEAAAGSGDTQSAADEARAESMAFLYPGPSTGTSGTDPSDSRVVVEDVPAMTVVSVAVRGRYGLENHPRAVAAIQEHLKANPGRYRVVGQFRFLGYNSPFVLSFLKMGEVQLPVELIQPGASAPVSSGSARQTSP